MPLLICIPLHAVKIYPTTSRQAPVKRAKTLDAMTKKAAGYACRRRASGDGHRPRRRAKNRCYRSTCSTVAPDSSTHGLLRTEKRGSAQGADGTGTDAEVVGA